MFATRKKVVTAVALATCLLLVGSGCGSGGGNEATPTPEPTSAEPTTPAEESPPETQDPILEYPRNETVITSGSQWGPPSSWNPIPGYGDATGTRGLLYETLFHFNPTNLEFKPWLAEKGEWTDAQTYTVTLREGLKWQDGKDLTSADVVFTTELGKKEGIPWQNLWTWLDTVEAPDAKTVVWRFSESRPQEFENWLYTRTMLPQHILSTWSDEELTSNANENPVGSGPFKYLKHDQDRMVWERDDNWWGIAALGVQFPMRFVVDIVNPSNEVALGLLMQGQLDLSNNFLPGIQQLVSQGAVKTYFTEAPYMVSANTAWLIPNATKAPGNDAAFRRALAHAIDVDTIVSSAYGGIVTPSNPAGLLPIYDKFIDKAVIDQYGFSYDPAKAEKILTDAGYTKGSDGFFQNKDGSAMKLELTVPAGWTDWMDAAQIIADSASKAGINVVAAFPDSGAVDDARTAGTFELTMNNWAQMSNTPWTYYNMLFNMPIQDDMWSGNFGRWDATAAFAVVNDLARAQTGTPEFQAAMSKLQQISLEEMPMIPMWYNGMWSQVTEGTWTNWPQAGTANTAFPCTWHGYWEMGGIETLANLKPAG